MSLFKQLLAWGHQHLISSDEQNRKRELIHTITFELLILGIILVGLNIYLHFWFLSCLLITGTIITTINLFLLKKGYSFLLCGHIINLLVLLIISLGNLWLGGLASSYVGWFYISPIIAAATIGLDGLIIYGLLSAAIFIFFISGYLTPFIILPENYLWVLNNLNYIFIFLLIFTTLYNLLTQNKLYETLLKEQNYLLYADKQKFHYLSHHDSLTNLPNRAYFNHYLQSVMDSTKTATKTLTLYFMDLDGFKKINDLYGHEIGDSLLLKTSKRLQSCFRENDFIARLGGDEFTAVITHELEDSVAEDLTKRIENEFMQPFVIKDLAIKCTISIGKANYPSDALYSDVLLKIADDAMYKNKKLKYQINQQN